MELTPVMVKLMESGGRYNIVLNELSDLFDDKEAYYKALNRPPKKEK